MNNTGKYVAENYCNGCDEVVHTLCDTGTLLPTICPNCGAVVLPCNDCETRLDCDKCPHRDKTPVKALTEDEYLRWIEKNDPVLYAQEMNESI